MESKTVEATKRNEAKASFEALIGQFGPMLVDRGITPPSLDDKDDAAAITMKARELGGHVVAMQVALSPTAPAPLSQPNSPSLLFAVTPAVCTFADSPHEGRGRREGGCTPNYGRQTGPRS